MARIVLGFSLIALPFIIGAIVAAGGVKTVPGWFAASYIAASGLLIVAGCVSLFASSRS